MKLTEIRSAMAVPLITLSEVLLSEGHPFSVKVAVGESKEDEPLDRMIVGVTLGPPMPELEVALDELLEPEGERSVKALLEADRTLGGVVDDLIVIGNSGYRLYPGPEGPILGAEWTVNYAA